MSMLLRKKENHKRTYRIQSVDHKGKKCWLMCGGKSNKECISEDMISPRDGVSNEIVSQTYGLGIS